MNPKKGELYICISRPSFLESVFAQEQFSSEFKIMFISEEEAGAGLVPHPEKRNAPAAAVIDCSGDASPDSIEKNLRIMQDAQIPVVAFTPPGDTETKIKLLDAGACSVPDSSCDKTLLLHEIRSIIRRTSEMKAAQTQGLARASQKNECDQAALYIDKKIGISNRYYFLKATKKLIRANPDKKYTLLQFDLDRFKVFNDLFGFSEGDKILAKIGARLHNVERQGCTIGYLYADHFIICAETSNLNPESVAKQISDFVHNLRNDFNFIVRVGLYDIPSPDIDISLACDRAGIALHSIKSDFAKRYAYFDDSMSEQLKEEQTLVTSMLSAIQNEEFEIYFQPQYDYSTDSLIGAEALVRWNHPQQGLIMPGQFIPVFERNKFITQLDEYIWNKACQFLRRWIDKGIRPVPIAVNISRRDIYNTDIPDFFDRLMKKYDLDPALLRLEITESAYMENLVQLVDVVNMLRSRGFCVEMDDFGSGYSSLNTLKDVPVDILKLDMKFIMDGTAHLNNPNKDNSRGKIILSSVVRMASWLDLPVIAEGIESKEQADFLKSIGCYHMQGFYFAKPMPADQYEAILSARPAAPAKNAAVSYIGYPRKNAALELKRERLPDASQLPTGK